MGDSNAAIEYQTFKIPYEVLNKQFREAQKSMARQQARIKDVTKVLDDKIEGGQAIPVDEVKPALVELKNRIDAMQTLMHRSLAEQQETVHDMQQRAHYLSTGVDSSLNEHEQWTWEKERIDRLVLQHLLRSGQLETAKALAEKTGLSKICDLRMFEQAYVVEKALRSGDTGPCLEWIHEHRSRLRRLSSELETEVRILDAVELVKNGQRVDALNYARKFLKQSLEEGSDHVRKLWAAIACGAAHAAYKELAAEDRWERVAQLFRQENARIYQLPEQSAFSACLQAGLAAHKTPACGANANPNCVACDTTVHAIVNDLPYAHATNSKLICGHTGEPLDEKNVPMMLETGHVVGERALRQLRDGDFIKFKNGTTHINDVKRLFIL
ncbi:unnamed protein product, partial [Mesorhabditis spiculigera]